MEITRLQPPRRWLRFSLSSLLIAMTVASIFLGWWRQRALAQKAAREAIEAEGGWCHYDYEFVSDKLTAGAPSPVPSWLLDQLGYDYFHPVVEVNMVYNDVGGGRADNDNVSSAALDQLPGFPRLKRLLLKETQATDEGLAKVGRLSELEAIYMWDARAVTDVGIEHLANLRQLKTLHCSESQMTDRSLRTLAKLPRLEKLSLQGNTFSDQGLYHVREMTQLKQLVVGRTIQHGGPRKPITDEGLKHLQRLTKLELLDLQATQITPACLPQLALFPSLTELWLGSTAVKANDVKQLQAALPKCRISVDD